MSIMKSIQLPDVHMQVSDEGTGTPLLLVHGFPLNHTMWQHQMRVFRQNYRVIAPDLRGFGHSGVTAGKVTMEQFADDLNGLLDGLEIREPVLFCCLSMGGYIAWQFWRQYADRVRALVLCDTRAVADSEEAVKARLALADKVLKVGPQAVADVMLPKLFSRDTQSRRPEVEEAVRLMMMSTDSQGVAAALRGMVERPDVTPQLAGISVPALVIVGAEDAISPPAEMRAIAAAIPGAEYLEVPDAGHMAPLECPGPVNEALSKFLTSC
jgi:pimeloyl-ACP methyl ester carboxylesterase